MKRIGWLWRNLFRRSTVESELQEEIASFVEMLTDEKIAAGMPAHQARRAAKVELGSAESVKEAVRSMSAGSKTSSAPTLSSVSHMKRRKALWIVE